MDLTIASLLDVVDRLGWIGGRTDLLTYPEYVLFKGIDTMIDEKRIRLGLKLNVYALPFNPQALIQESSVIDHEHINEEKQEENKITSIKHNTNTQRQTQEKWVEVSVKNSRYTKVKEYEMKTKQQQLDKSSLTKKKTNRYQDLKEKEEEEEEEIKIEEDYTVEIKTNAIGDVKEEKVVSNTYEINKMTLNEVERFCVQDAEYDEDYILRDGNGKDIIAKTIKEETESEDEDEISSNEADDSDDSLYLTEEESTSSDTIEEEDDREVVKMTKEEEKRKYLGKEKNKEEKSINGSDEKDHKMRQLLYQNDLLLFRLEQAEEKEEMLRKEMNLLTDAKRNDTNQEIIRLKKQVQEKEEEQTSIVKEYEHKLEVVEKALAAKTKQLIDQLRRKNKSCNV